MISYQKVTEVKQDKDIFDISHLQKNEAQCFQVFWKTFLFKALAIDVSNMQIIDFKNQGTKTKPKSTCTTVIYIYYINILNASFI